MSTTCSTSYAQQITELLRSKPAHDAPEHVKAAWTARKVELLAAVETVEAQR